MFRPYDKVEKELFGVECKTVQDAIKELEEEILIFSQSSSERHRNEIYMEQGNDLGYCIANVSLIPILITDNMKVMIKQ